MSYSLCDWAYRFCVRRNLEGGTDDDIQKVIGFYRWAKQTWKQTAHRNGSPRSYSSARAKELAAYYAAGYDGMECEQPDGEAASAYRAGREHGEPVTLSEVRRVEAS